MEPIQKPSTIKEYLSDSYKFSIQATILEIINDPIDSLPTILFDRTIFHPQGGGQPSDTGYVEGLTLLNDEKIKFNVKNMIYNRENDQVWHKGEYESKGRFQVGDKVQLNIDENNRRLYARLHSAGHLLDIAVKNLGLKWIPGKGHHFPDVSYVEYIGTIPEGRKNLGDELSSICQGLIASTPDANQVDVTIYEYEEAKKVIEVPDYLPSGKPIRYIRLSKEDDGCPCGGTHVKHLKDIQKIEVTKVQKKGKNVRVSYKISAQAKGFQSNVQ